MGSQGDLNSQTRSSKRGPSPPHLVLLGANHRTCPLDERERLLRRATYARLRRRGPALRPWDDLVLLTTCNRIEAYALTSEPRAAIETLRDAFGAPPGRDALYALEGADAAAHLLRVAAGLDSMAQGEEQVTAQVRRALASRPRARRPSHGLSEAFERAARAAPRIRSLSGLDARDASASHAALRFLETSVPLLHPTVALLGTGKMARIAARSLRDRSSIVVLDRNLRKANDIARELDGRGFGREDLDRVLELADVVLAATAAPRYLVSSRRLRRVLRRRQGRPLWLIDLGFPRNLDPACGQLPGVTLVDLDGLAPYGTRPLPPAALARAEARIRDEAERLVASLNPATLEDVADLRRAVETIRRTEVDAALERIPDLTDADRAVVDKLATRLVNRFLHGPTEHLRSLPEEERGERVRELLRGFGEAGR